MNSGWSAERLKDNLWSMLKEGERVKERRESFWRGMRQVVLGVALVALSYSVAIHLFARGEFIGWLNTLVSTIISVVCAAVIGLGLFYYQDTKTDQGRKESLSRLLKAELTEVRRLIEGSRTVVPDDALKPATERTPGRLETRVALHYVHPLTNYLETL